MTPPSTTELVTSMSSHQQISSSQFDKVSKFIYSNFGIKLPPTKMTMVEGRLHKRMRTTGITNFADYIDFVFSKAGAVELVHMVDMLTTNKTEFLRESTHFDYMTDVLLPQLDDRRHLRIWSAGCSSGEEPYTLAMVLEEYRRNRGSSLDYSIFATDLSTRMLNMARTGVYPENKLTAVPLEWKRRYMLRSKDRTQPTGRVRTELRSKVQFRQLNFLDADYKLNFKFDIVFCRNVIIYFDRDTQERVLNQLVRQLHPEGYLFLGHSESITNMNVPVSQVRPTIFRK